MQTISAAKAQARQAAKIIRAGRDPALGVNLTNHVLNHCKPPSGAVVAGFWPLEDEIDIRSLLLALSDLGHQIALPETSALGMPLCFRKWMPGDVLVPGRFGTMHPAGEVLVPDFILVPLLAFDAKGNRLGYGGGYYDRSLAALPNAFRLGCAFAAQEIAEVPAGPLDLKLHAIATEQGIRRF